MLALIMIIVFPSFYLLGRTVIGIAYGPAGRERFFLEDKVITGMVLTIGLAECAHIGAFVSGRSVCVSAKYFVMLVICVVACCAIVSFIRYLIGKKQKDHKNGSRPIFSAIHPDRREIVFFAIWMLLLAWQLFAVFYQCRVFQEADITLETVVSFLETDILY